MLNFFRRGIVSKLMLGVLGIGLFAIVITGFGTSGLGGLGGIGALSADTLVQVGGEKVTATDMTEQVARQLDRARAEQPETDLGAFLGSGAYEQILKQYITQKAMRAFGEDLGLAASKRMVDGEIASIPAFRNLAGQFDEATFRAAIAREGVTEDALRDDISGSMIERQLLLPVAGSVRIPDAMARRYASLLLESRTGSVGLVPAQRVGPGKEPTDAEVAAHYRQNQARYSLPERRALRYAEFGGDQVAAAARPTPAELQKYYDDNQALYGPKQTRRLSQVVLPSEAAARALAGKVRGGASFEAAAREAGFSAADTTIGSQNKADFARLTSPAIADAAFSAAQGAITAPARSSVGWHVVRVDAIETAPARPFAAVRDEIEGRLFEQKSKDALAAMVNRIEDKIGGGASFEEVAREERLQIRETPPLTAGGIQYDDPNFKAPELQPLLKSAFDMSSDDDPVVEALVPDQRYALFAVSRVVQAAPVPLPQIKGRVKAELARKRANDRAKAVASALVAKINGGVAPAQAFAQVDVPLPPPEPVSSRRIDIARPNQPVPAPLAMLFSLPQGRARLVQAPNGAGWFVVHLSKATPGDAATNPQLVQATRSQFQRIIGDEYAAQFARAVEQHVGVERNEEAIRKTKQAIASGQTNAR